MKYMELLHGLQAGIHKRAGIYADLFKAIPGGMAAELAVPGLGQVVQTGGQIAGIVEDNPNRTTKEWEKWTPGFAAAGIQRQRRALSKKHGNGRDQYTAASEAYGPITSTLAPVILGAALGAGVGGVVGAPVFAGTDEHGKVKTDNNKGVGALAGAGVGALAGGGIAAGGQLLGALLAAVRGRRTQEEQRAYEHGSKLQNWLLPGAATYNQFKAFGRIHGDQVEEEQKAADLTALSDRSQMAIYQMLIDKGMQAMRQEDQQRQATEAQARQNPENSEQ